MRIKGIAAMIFITLIILTLSTVNASEVGINETGVYGGNVDYDNILNENQNSIYVDVIDGDNSNNGYSKNSSIKTLDKALTIANDNDTIYLSNGNYVGLANTKLTVNKSINLIGSDATIFDGQNMNYIFIISDNVTVTFKNIKFINSFKSPSSYSSTFNENVYGAALDIKKATVYLDNCSFINNTLSYGNNDKNVFGGAISNFGYLTIINSYFESNVALSTSGLWSYGGSVFNKGKLVINNSEFYKSKGADWTYGAGIANDGDAVLDNCIVRDLYSKQESKGSAIYNKGNLILLNSIIENNYIEKSDFRIIYGAIYNSGNLTARGTIFRNNSAKYDIPSLKGSPTIYNSGTLNLTYNAFIDNSAFNDEISRDVYFNAGKIISLDNNWWNTNENPYSDSTRINIDEINSWLTFNLSPEYSKLDIGDNVTITAFWSNNNDDIQINLFPLFNVTFNPIDVTNELKNGSASFVFNNTQNKGSYEVTASVNGFTQNILIDVGKINTFVNIDANNNLTYGETLNLNITVFDENNTIQDGNVSIMINGETYTVNLVNGKAHFNISDLAPEKYILKVIYEGNEDYYKAFNSTTVTVNKQDVELIVTIPEIKVDKKGNAVVTLLSKGVQGQAIVYIDGVRKKIVYLYNGNTTIALNNFGEGEYNISVEFVETNFYNSAIASNILKVTKYDSDLNVSIKDIKAGENATLIINVTPETLRGEALLIINNVTNEIWIGNSTTVINLANFSAGHYDVTVLFKGDSKYYGSNSSCSFNVVKTSTVLDVDLNIDEKTLNGTIVVKTNPINCTGAIGVYINYNRYTLNLSDGEAKFNVKFDKGTNYIFVYYEGDDSHEDASWNTTWGVSEEVIFIGQNSTGWEYNDFNYSVRLIEQNGIPMPNRNISITFNEKTHVVTTNDNGYAYFKLNLSSGIYNISASYKNSTVHNILTVNEVKFNLTTNNISYGENESVIATFEEGVVGTVNFIIPDILNVTVEIIDNKAICNIPDLDVGNYNVKAVYNQLKEVVNDFNVNKANLNWNVEANNVSVNTEQIIKVQNLDKATGNMTFIVNNKEYFSDIINSQSILNLGNLSKGNYTLIVKYDGDLNYNPINLTTIFYVKEFSSDIVLKIDDGVYGQDLVATATLNDDATGIVRFIFGNSSKDIEIKNAVAEWKFSGLDVGNYEIQAIYLGNHYYTESSNLTSFNVLKANSSILLYTKGAYLNENIRIYANLSANATGYVTFSMEGYYSPRNKVIVNSTSNWYISPLDTGEYKIIAIYKGDKNYYESNTTYILNITQKRAILNVEIEDVGLNNRVIAKINLSSVNGEKISSDIELAIGNKVYEIDVINGEAILIVGKMAEGNYTYAAIYEGDANYSKASCSGKFEVKNDLLDVILSANNVTKYYKGEGRLIVSLLSSSEKPLVGETIGITINGKTYSCVTDSLGKAYLDINLKSGTYNALITFNQTSRYHGSSINASVNVLATVEGLDVVKLYGSGTQYFAIFVDSNGDVLANTQVKFKIGSNTYTATTLPNGITRLNINFNPGNYVITAINPVTGEKTTNNIFIYNYLMENKDITKYFGGSQDYKVRAYGVDGKPVTSGVTVTIKVNGVSYKVKTDDEGYAKLAINLKPGSYTIKATYNGVTVSNKIVVKKVLITNNVVVKKGNKITFTAKLLDTNGKALSGKKINFQFKGKTYSANTNSKGIATLNIKLSLSAGKYQIKSVYGKSIETNTITIK